MCLFLQISILLRHASAPSHCKAHTFASAALFLSKGSGETTMALRTRKDRADIFTATKARAQISKERSGRLWSVPAWRGYIRLPLVGSEYFVRPHWLYCLSPKHTMQAMMRLPSPFPKSNFSRAMTCCFEPSQNTWYGSSAQEKTSPPPYR